MKLTALQMRRSRLACLVPLLLLGAAAGCVDQVCYSSVDCDTPKVCGAAGRCEYECSDDAECGANLRCVAHRCQTRAQTCDAETPEACKDASLPVDDSGVDAPDGNGDAGPDAHPQPPSCPAEMVNVGNSFCIDRYEASRPDATVSQAGSDESRAVSKAGVMPWQLVGVDENARALAACQASGKSLCTPEEWQVACRGPDLTTYGYGDEYEPQTCNGIDTFGRTGFQLLPTGSMSDCINAWGAYDMNGNLWEHVLGGDATMVRGGAFNCSDSRSLHRCDYIPGSWSPSARGFRCCKALL